MRDLLKDQDPAHKIGALILAGGAGRRVNGQDKGLLEWQGKPLVDHVVERLRPQVDRIYISCNRNRHRYRQRATLVPPDLRFAYQGPLAGLEAAAGTLNHDYVLVVPCDVPRLPKDLLTRLRAGLQAHSSCEVAYASTTLSPHYLCALVRVRSLKSLSRFLDSGGRAVHAWYTDIGAVAVNFDDCADAFLNVNRLND